MGESKWQWIVCCKHCGYTADPEDACVGEPIDCCWKGPEWELFALVPELQAAEIESLRASLAAAEADAHQQRTNLRKAGELAGEALRCPHGLCNAVELALRGVVKRSKSVRLADPQ